MTLSKMSQSVPCAAIEAALDQTGKREQRARKLPSALVLQLIIALGLLADLARRQVLATLRPPSLLEPLAGKVAICQACQRVGAPPMIVLFRSLARPLAEPATTPQAFYHGWRLAALDGSNLDLPDSPANVRAFGRPGAARGHSAFPQAKIITLVECGTRLLLDLEVRPACRGELQAARRLIQRSVGPRTLVLYDRGLHSYRTMAAILERGAQFLGRVSSHCKLLPMADGILPDGSWLCQVEPDPRSRQAGAPPLVVRVIEYRLHGHTEVIRLVTSLVYPELAPAEELAALFPERWEVETFLDELKTHQQGRPNGQHVALHAQTPAGVVQEIYGLGLAHRVIHTLMLGAAVQQEIDPDRLSFKNALVIVRRYLPALAQASKKARLPLLPKSCWRSAASVCRHVSTAAISVG